MSDDLEDIVDNLREPSAWIRIVFMVGFAVVLYLIIAPVVLVLMIVQALFSVLSGETNYNLRRFGKALAEYVQQILHYLSYNTNDKPFRSVTFRRSRKKVSPQILLRVRRKVRHRKAIPGLPPRRLPGKRVLPKNLLPKRQQRKPEPGKQQKNPVQTQKIAIPKPGRRARTVLPKTTRTRVRSAGKEYGSALK